MHCPIEWLPAQGRAEQLVLMLHGWGGSGAAMAPLAQALRRQFAQAALIAPDAPLPQDGRAADAPQRQWYSLEGLEPGNWPARVDAALPELAAWVRAMQRHTGVGPAATAIAGFSQGAILALALALAEDGACGRVLAFAGCFTKPPEAAPENTTLHLFHGDADEVIPAEGSRQALAWMDTLRGDATLDIAHGVGHVLHPALIDCALHRLTHHIPQRTWRAALGSVPAGPSARGDH